MFDSSRTRNSAFVFKLGTGQVIKGWDQGLLDMYVTGTSPGSVGRGSQRSTSNRCVGEHRVLTIEPELGYGAGGYPPIIPANAVLTFDVELLAIKSSKPNPVKKTVEVRRAAPPFSCPHLETCTK